MLYKLLSLIFIFSIFSSCGTKEEKAFSKLRGIMLEYRDFKIRWIVIILGKIIQKKCVINLQ